MEKVSPVGVPVSRYQSFEPGSGSSDSFGKLKALHLPDLAGKRFLDLGCNHGFFCFEALKRGAREVVGVDRDPNCVRAAEARAATLGVSDRVRFVNKSWDEFRETGFDVIILLSALHYAADQPALLRKIAGMLNPEGIFILEGGVLNNPRRDWTSVIRGKPPYSDIVEYPTPRVMFEMLSENFAPRDIGPSVIQPGDNVPRIVWHCRKRKRMLLCIGAAPNKGKTTLAFSFQRKGVPVIDIDVVVVGEFGKDSPIGRCIAPVFRRGALQLCFEQIEHEGLYDDLAALVIDAAAKVPPVEGTIILMGMALINDNFRRNLRKMAREHHMIVWEAERSV